jgi:hypothetical protein
LDVEAFALPLRALEADVDAAVLGAARDVARGAVDAHAAVTVFRSIAPETSRNETPPLTVFSDNRTPSGTDRR